MRNVPIVSEAAALARGLRRRWNAVMPDSIYTDPRLVALYDAFNPP